MKLEISEIYEFWNLNILIPNYKLCFAVVSSLDYTSLLQKQPPQVFCKNKVFLEILQNWQENTCAKDLFLIKLKDLQTTASVTCEVFLFNFEL